MDERLGQHGGAEPTICAVTGQACAGRHSSHYSLGDGYYITILEKAAMGMTREAIAKVVEECKALVPRSNRARITPKQVEEE